MKDLNYYLGLPYTIVMKRDEEGDFVARIEELQGCTAHGLTAQEAVDNLEEQKKAWIEDSIEAGDEVPEPPTAEDVLPSGKWLQRVPRSLHLKLVRLARSEKTSLNTLVTGILAEAVGKKAYDQGIVGQSASLIGSFEYDAHGPFHDKWESDAQGYHEVVICPTGHSEIRLVGVLDMLTAAVPRRLRTGLKAIENAQEKRNIKIPDSRVI
jgi:antitoxin HicB